MIDEVAENIFRVEIPLTVPLLDSMNAYIVKDSDRTLIVDSGMSQNRCEEVMRETLQDLDIDLTRTDFFITHHHGDHFGLVGRLIADGAIIYISGPEADMIERIRSRAILADVTGFIELTGFPEKDLSKIIPPHAGSEYQAREMWPFTSVSDGDVISRGGYSFRCVVTPGHSPGHACLYDEGKGVLFSGDHILASITPAIQLRSDQENPLNDYLKSLERLSHFSVRLVLPGHSRIFTNYTERVAQLMTHHGERAADVLAALAGGEKDAYEVASRIPWSIVDFDGWEGVPLIQKFFATGEAFSHLKYLEETGRVRKEKRGQRLIYALASKEVPANPLRE
jgi:glyoxylase-like metal-dependent hydrolase (beta-lactamase superfamily II)